MSFMVVNTGRAASRAFYLTLKRQAGVVCISRYELDRAIGGLTKRGRSAPLRDLIDAYRMAGALGKERVAGLVFHDARGRLKFPYDHPSNEQALGRLRDGLGVRTVFFLVREPRSMVLSELNRSLAKRVGDWSFKTDRGSWRSTFTPDELSDLARRPPAPGAPLPPAPEYGIDELRDMTLLATERTGKVHSLFKLFEKVFGEVRYVDYEDFIARPVETYSRMAAISGTTFEDDPLVHTKLNSLSNRLLLSNPIHVAGPKPTRRRFFGGARPAVRYRFELTSVLPLCDDWGHYEPLTHECSRELAAVEADCRERLSLGVCSDDLAAYSPAESEVLRSPELARTLLAGVGPLFVDNYLRTKAFFRGMYRDEVPAPVYDAFWKREAPQYEALQAERDRGRLVPI